MKKLERTFEQEMREILIKQIVEIGLERGVDIKVERSFTRQAIVTLSHYEEETSNIFGLEINVFDLKEENVYSLIGSVFAPQGKRQRTFAKETHDRYEVIEAVLNWIATL